MSIMLTTASTAPAKDRPTFTLQLRPEPGVDPVHALRSALKRLLRQLWRKKRRLYSSVEIVEVAAPAAAGVDEEHHS
jgi:hypothetical protein